MRKRITITLDADLIEWIKDEADAEQRSDSGMIGKLLDEARGYREREREESTATLPPAFPNPPAWAAKWERNYRKAHPEEGASNGTNDP